VPSRRGEFPDELVRPERQRPPDLPGTDRYAQANTASPLALSGTTWHQNIDPNIKTPYLNEYRVGIERQLGELQRGCVGPLPRPQEPDHRFFMT
jgi:hypothetical protein